ncbi:hypothetical protein D8S78_05895 [Natrialba swarupiae]|nr:hypothetical protein [Natrialba swarupiae]
MTSALTYSKPYETHARSQSADSGVSAPASVVSTFPTDHGDGILRLDATSDSDSIIRSDAFASGMNDAPARVRLEHPTVGSRTTDGGTGNDEHSRRLPSLA